MSRITRKMAALTAVAALFVCSSAFAETYYADPARGKADGDGSRDKPWSTLAEVISQGKLKTLKGGDTLLLADGYHGDIKFSGDNDSTVTIAAAPGARPHVSRLEIPSGSNWTVKGLVVSSSFGRKPYKGFMVSFADGGPSSKIAIEDCYVFNEENSSGWDVARWMDCNSGINMGRNGKDHVLRNNYVKNVRFGISLSAADSLCEGNVVSDFSADAMRATRDGETVQYNIMKNCYVSDADGDKNHDDGLQVFLFNKGTGLVKNVSTIGNIIIAHEDPKQKFPNTLQGLGFFDGPLDGFVVKDNVISVDSWHGISLYDAQGCTIENNVVWTPEDKKMRAWIMLGTKLKETKENTVKNNYAPTFKVKIPGTTEENNKKVTEAIYQEALKKAYKVICEKFGEKHFAADCERLTIK